jgi:hypothetical protein
MFAEGALLPGFPDDGITRDERGRSVWVDEAYALRSMYHDCDRATAMAAYARLRPQAAEVYDGDYPRAERPPGRASAIIGTQDAAMSPEWLRRVSVERLGVEPHEIDTSHSPMLSRPSDLANLLDELA